MTKIKFIHTADLHLDTPFKGLSNWNPVLAEKLKDATYRSFSNITDLCISEVVDFLLIAGDIFDNENMSLAAQIRFLKQLERLSENEIPVYFICGNHDHLGSWNSRFSIPGGAYRFGASGVERVTFKREGKIVADIYGISYQSDLVKDNLALLYKLAGDPAPLSVAMLHGMADITGRDERYSPFSLDDLLERGFDYWALGHVHRRRVLNGNPPVIYPGNPQGRDFGETGEKGCYLVELAVNREPVIKFKPVQHIRFEEIEIDLTGKNDISILDNLIHEAKVKLAGFEDAGSIVLRIRLTGRTILHASLNRPGETDHIRDLLNEGQLDMEYFTWVDTVDVDTRPAVEMEQLAQGSDFIAEIIRRTVKYEEDTAFLTELVEKLLNELPLSQIARETDGLSGLDKREVLEKSRWILLDKLLNEVLNDN